MNGARCATGVVTDALRYDHVDEICHPCFAESGPWLRGFARAYSVCVTRRLSLDFEVTYFIGVLDIEMSRLHDNLK